MVPGLFKTVIPFLRANPDLGLIWISNPLGIATLKPPGIKTLSPAFNWIVLSMAALISIPAEP